MLRDFWFPLLLTLGSIAPGFAAIQSEGNAKRLWWTITATMWFFSVLSYIWGDPVRGPFEKLIHPHSSDTFSLYAGIKRTYPIRQLSEGIDFSDTINLEGKPIQLSVKKTWWSGWKCNLKMALEGGGLVTLMENNKVSDDVPVGFDINFDDRAVEVVNEQRLPVFQLIQDGDYDLHINTLIVFADGRALILKDDKLFLKPSNRIHTSDIAVRLFKYPAYANRGRRE